MYELTFILNDEAELKTISSLITSLKGKVVSEKKWERHEFAYPIGKITSGNYYTWMIEMGAKDISELKKRLNFNEKMIRYLILSGEDTE